MGAAGIRSSHIGTIPLQTCRLEPCHLHFNLLDTRSLVYPMPIMHRKHDISQDRQQVFGRNPMLRYSSVSTFVFAVC